jgi:hypothetical protein
MQAEVITRRDDLLIRRLILGPGEAMPWHTDVCHRFSVIVHGQHLTLEFRDTGERMGVAVHPGMAGWDAPEARVHRAVNTGSTPSRRIPESGGRWCLTRAPQRLPGMDPLPRPMGRRGRVKRCRPARRVSGWRIPEAEPWEPWNAHHDGGREVGHMTWGWSGGRSWEEGDRQGCQSLTRCQGPPNKGMQATGNSLRSSLAPALSRA